MAYFIVMDNDTDKRQESLHFVRDGFAYMAFGLPVLWLLWHRLTLHAALCFAALGGLAALIYWVENPLFLGLAALMSAGISLLVALEGGEWQRAALAQQGYREIEIISARNEAQAAEIFASRLLGTTPPRSTNRLAPDLLPSLIPLTGL